MTYSDTPVGRAITAFRDGSMSWDAFLRWASTYTWPGARGVRYPDDDYELTPGTLQEVLAATDDGVFSRDQYARIYRVVVG